ncbi:MAG: hypothetical protein M1834_002715 [Cirrosporium novae-zelandiae]|nr:MAG: hypothetical protein M1834_002715 [Cirrosporium novae-zelandiae]
MMSRKREKSIIASILEAVLSDEDIAPARSLLTSILAFCSPFRITLTRFKQEIFARLRTDVWGIDENEYKESFRQTEHETALKPVGDLGYSVKSLPRHFEHNFFQDELLEPYRDHMEQYPSSLLVQITDFIWAPSVTLGGMLGLIPQHHIVMENALYGKDDSDSSNGDKWEVYDLKPADYFFPERDLMEGRLASEATKSRLADVFEDKMRITNAQYEQLQAQLEYDTSFLKDANAVDYSLLLVRHLHPGYPNPNPNTATAAAAAGSKKMKSKEDSSSWRIGIISTDRKWTYRLVLLDFFWAKHKLHAKAMTGVVESFNVVGRKGPMSITTTPEEYQQRFMNMIRGIVETEGSFEDD